MSAALEQWEGASAEEWSIRLGADRVELHAVVDSTNRRASEIAHGVTRAVVVADRQTAGKGRLGRSWESDTADGLWVSVVLRAREAGGGHALLAGLAVLRAVEALVPPECAERLSLKWPNDVLLDGKKLAGVLCASVAERVVVGMGVNANHDGDSLPRSTDYPATSVREACGVPIARGELLSGIVEELDELWTDTGDLPDSVLEEINGRSWLRGRVVAATGTARQSSGGMTTLDAAAATAGSVAQDGCLELITERGSTMHLVAGSVRLAHSVQP